MSFTLPNLTGGSAGPVTGDDKLTGPVINFAVGGRAKASGNQSDFSWLSLVLLIVVGMVVIFYFKKV